VHAPHQRRRSSNSMSCFFKRSRSSGTPAGVRHFWWMLTGGGASFGACHRLILRNALRRVFAGTTGAGPSVSVASVHSEPLDSHWGRTFGLR